ncbi:hypothetical protein [Morganella morganii]|uniref:hypothetical protein n=1 Tax=Morganella morganii TaxID=582 RepID=UPI0031382F30
MLNKNIVRCDIKDLNDFDCADKNPLIDNCNMKIESYGLSDKEITELNKAVLNDHALLSVDKLIITKESAEIRGRFNAGENLSCDEIMSMPYSENIIEKKITDENDLLFLVEYAKEKGRDLQELFETDEYIYTSLFIDKENINELMMLLLKKYEMSESLKEYNAVTLTLSFPLTNLPD